MELMLDLRQGAAVHCHLAVLNGLCHWEALADARGIGQNDTGSSLDPLQAYLSDFSWVGIRFNERSHRLLSAHVHTDAGHIHILLGHGQLSQVR